VRVSGCRKHGGGWTGYHAMMTVYSSRYTVMFLSDTADGVVGRL
jgi:hypothetical protein